MSQTVARTASLSDFDASKAQTGAMIQSSSRELDDLSEVIDAYNHVTESLRQSHEKLRSEVVRLQHQLASADAKLQRSKRLAALGEMAAGIAHEIRNPLGAIQLYANMLTQDLPSDTPSGGVAGKISSAVRGLNAIVCDVLTFAKEMRPLPRPIFVVELLNRAVEGHRPAIEEFGVEVQLDVEQDLLLEVDVDLLRQALLNLIRNAVDAMSAVGIEQPVLRLHARHADAQVVLTVADNGPGIDEDQIDRIFNPFFTTRNTGTGLGLAIVHRIVDAHGGAIAVHNDDGAVFELLLPARQGGAESEAAVCDGQSYKGAA